MIDVYKRKFGIYKKVASYPTLKKAEYVIQNTNFLGKGRFKIGKGRYYTIK